MDVALRKKVNCFIVEGGVTTHQILSVPEQWFGKHFGVGEVESVPCGSAKDWHNTDNRTHSQVILAGGFTVIVGPEGNEKRIRLGVGDIAIFRDDSGRGHASKVDEFDLGDGIGCRRYHCISEAIIP